MLDLDIVSNKVTFADAFTDIEPTQYFNCYQCVQPGISHWGLLPLSILCRPDQAGNALADCWEVTRCWWG